MVKKNIFVLLGGDARYKKIQLDKIRADLEKDKGPLVSIPFYVAQTALFDLQKELENLSLSPRLFIFRNSQDLQDPLKAYLKDFLTKRKDANFFIFDFDVESQREDLMDDEFFSFLFTAGASYKLAGAQREFTLRDLAVSLKKNAQSQSLLILSALFKKHTQQKISMQILGLIVKLFVDVDNQAKRRKFIKDIFDTDRAIKEGLLDSRQALESLILTLTKEGFEPKVGSRKP